MKLSLLIALQSTAAVQPPQSPKPEAAPVASQPETIDVGRLLYRRPGADLRTALPPQPPQLPPAAPSPYSSPQPSRQVMVVEVEVRGGSELLWSGALRIAVGSAASFRRTLSQAPAELCRELPYGGRSEQQSLNLTITQNYPGERGETFAVQAEWQRPAPDPCSPGTRTVQLIQTVQLVSDGWASVSGDGGLVVRLRRR